MKNTMKNTRKPLSILLALCMIVGLLPWATLSARAEEPTGTFADLQARLDENGTVKLDRDYKAGKEESMLTIPADASVTLDLNGHVIDRDREEEEDHGGVIEVLGSLTLTDTGTTPRYGYWNEYGFYELTTTQPSGTYDLIPNGGAICGGVEDLYGGGVRVGVGGTFTMNGGAICGNYAGNDGGGVYIGKGGNYSASGGGTFTMNGGVICGNVANYGGGVYVGGSSAFTMEDGTIAENIASYGGGGVCVYYDSNIERAPTFTMNDGTISGNSVRWNSTNVSGGGVYVYGIGMFTMNGGTISDNSVDWFEAPKGIGGGVCVRSCNYGGATFTMTGGEITRNTAAKVGGVCVEPYINTNYPSRSYHSSFNVSGGSVVSGNTAGGAASNVYLKDDSTITVTAALTGGAGCIGVTTEAPGVFARADAEYNDGKLTDADAACFTSDDDGYIPVLNADSAAELVGAMKVNSWSALYDALQKSGYVLLTGDVKYGEDDGDHASSALAVPNGETVTLDLAGHVIDRALESLSMSSGDYGNVVMISGTLTLVDSAPTGEHADSYSSLPAGGVITGAYGESGAVYIYDGGAFTMNGGTITGNHALYYGGGVHVRENGAFTMNGGTITGNTAGYDGNGVYVEGSFNVSGSACVSGKGSNVYLSDDSVITVTGALTGDAEIGVTMETPGVFAQADAEYNGGKLAETDLAHFTSDDPAYIVDVNENGEAYLFEEVVGVTGALANGKLTATVYAPDGGLLIAAAYDANGALVSVKVITVEASAEVRHIDAGLTVGKDETCKLMLVNASTYAPLCAAWNN